MSYIIGYYYDNDFNLQYDVFECETGYEDQCMKALGTKYFLKLLCKID